MAPLGPIVATPVLVPRPIPSFQSWERWPEDEPTTNEKVASSLGSSTLYSVHEKLYNVM